MQFKIKNTQLKISFSFLALILFFITVEKSTVLIYTVLFSFLHELVHIIFILFFCGAPKKITVSVFGATILKNSSSESFIKEIIVNLSAPFFNILTGILLINFSYSEYDLLQELGEINLMLGCFNLLPFYNLDGGIALKNLLHLFFNENLSEKIITVISVIVATLFMFISVYVFFNISRNPVLVMFSIYFIILVIFKK